jgi:hypothetical protein
MKMAQEYPLSMKRESCPFFDPLRMKPWTNRSPERLRADHPPPLFGA